MEKFRASSSSLNSLPARPLPCSAATTRLRSDSVVSLMLAKDSSMTTRLVLMRLRRSVPASLSCSENVTTFSMAALMGGVLVRMSWFTAAMVAEASAEISRRLLRPAARLVRVCSSSSLLSMRLTMLVICEATVLSSSMRSVAERAARTRSNDSWQTTVAPFWSGGSLLSPGMTPMYLSPRKPAVSMKNLASARIWYSALILASRVTM